MPFSSSAWMSVASVYSGGGWVNFWSAVSFFSCSFWPSSSGGRAVSYFLASSVDSSYSAVKPSNATRKPEARNR